MNKIFLLLLLSFNIQVNAQVNTQKPNLIQKSVLEGIFKYELDNEYYQIQLSSNAYQEFTNNGVFLSKGIVQQKSANEFEIVPLESTTSTRVTAVLLIKLVSVDALNQKVLVSDPNGNSREIVLTKL